MKRDRNGFGRFAALLAIVLVCLAGAVAFAGNVYDRTTKALGASTGVATWTNDYKYAAVELKRIWIESSLTGGTTVTVTRVTSDGTYTQAVGTVALTGVNSNGSTASFTANYLANGDMLKFASAVATGSTAIIEFEAGMPRAAAERLAGFVRCVDCDHWRPSGVQQHGDCAAHAGGTGGLWGTDARGCAAYLAADLAAAVRAMGRR